MLGVPGALAAIGHRSGHCALDGERGHVYVEPDERTQRTTRPAKPNLKPSASC